MPSLMKKICSNCNKSFTPKVEHWNCCSRECFYAVQLKLKNTIKSKEEVKQAPRISSKFQGY